MRSALAIRLAAPLVAMALSACSAPFGPDGTKGTAIQSHPYMQITQEVPTGTIINLADLLYNHDSTSFRVRSIRMISPSGPGIRDVQIRALAPSLDEGGTFILQGDLAKCPPGQLGSGAVPVTRIVEPPQRWTDWRTLVSLVFTKPGRYHLYLLKVDYVEGGQRHWDYVRANIIVRAVSSKSHPGLVQPYC